MEINEIASRVLEAKREIKRLTKQIKEDMEEIRDHVIETGEKELGDAEAYERKKRPRFVSTRSGLKVTQAVKALEADDEFDNATYMNVKTSLDLDKLLEGQGEDRALKKLLKKHGLELEQETEIHIKAF